MFWNFEPLHLYNEHIFLGPYGGLYIEVSPYFVLLQSINILLKLEAPKQKVTPRINPGVDLTTALIFSPITIGSYKNFGLQKGVFIPLGWQKVLNLHSKQRIGVKTMTPNDWSKLYKDGM